MNKKEPTNTAIIIRDKELIEKVDKLKKLFNYKTRSKYISKLIEERYDLYYAPVISSTEISINL